MKTRTLIATVLCLLAGIQTLPAQEAPAPASPATPAIPATPATTAVQAAEHPFIQTGFYPQWSKMTKEAALADLQLTVEMARTQLEAICSIEPGTETYENVFEAMENTGIELMDLGSYLGHLAQVMDSEEMRALQEEIIPIMSAFSAEISSNTRLWAVMKRAAAQPWVKDLSPAKQRYIQQTMDAFRDNGVELPPEKQQRKQEIMTEISQLQLLYDKNVQDSTYAWSLVITDPAQLDGMPDFWMEHAAAIARMRGHGTKETPQWYINLDPSSAGAVLSLCNVEETRKACWTGQNAVGRIGKYNNGAIVARILTLRQEMAELLGFKNYVDMVCRNRMVDNGDAALAFVERMAAQVLPAFQAENQALLDFISEQKGERVESLAPWDAHYYYYRYAASRANSDGADIRPYLRSDRVIQGMFDHFSKLYGITFSEVPSEFVVNGQVGTEGKVEVWHPLVKVYKVTDDKTGAHLGSFYLDLYPRAGKRDGAWLCPMRPGRPGKDGEPHTPHLGALVANLSSPTAAGFALFSQDDVTTLFHEFGHMMHLMLSDTELLSHMGTEVPLDFAELPSQMNENWAWEPEVIATYAFHYQTGEPIPAELVEKLLESRFFIPATEDMDQLRLAKLDLEMHMHYAEKFAGKSLDEACNEILTGWQMPFSFPSPSILYNFPHCISYGYAGGYFSYKWSEVLAADAFSRFKKEGITNPETGASFRETILSQGDSKPADQLYRDFMGRDPNPNALMEQQHLDAKIGK